MPTNADAVKLSHLFEPILFFDPTERFFPVAPEEWLTHRSPEHWNAPNADRRGTAVLRVARAQTSFGDADVVAGSHAPAGAAITLTDNAPDGIGQAFPVEPAIQDLFLDVGGWDDASAGSFETGSLEYLDLLFRDLGHVLNPSLEDEDPTPAPSFTPPRVTAPTVFAELDWAGLFPRLDRDRVVAEGGTRDFPASIGTDAPAADGVLRELDSYAILTYYLFYPAMEPAPSVRNDGVKRREGQWEAISIYLKCDRAEEHDRDGRPNFNVTVDETVPTEAVFPGFGQGRLVGGQARFVVYSQGYGAGADNDSPLPAEVRFIDAATLWGAHPLCWVTAGTHKNLFAPAAIITTGDSPPQPVLNSLGGALMGAAGTAAGVCLGIGAAGAASPAALFAIAAVVVCLVICAIVFLIGLILFILSFFLRDDPPVTEAPDPGGSDLARDGGPAAGVQGIGTPSRPGVTSTGNEADALLRIVNRFGFDPTPPVTTYPLPAPDTVELPTWWSYPGRWGVRVLNSPTSDWDSGTRRTDGFQRTRAYWNTYRLVEFLNQPERASDGIGP